MMPPSDDSENPMKVTIQSSTYGSDLETSVKIAILVNHPVMEAQTSGKSLKPHGLSTYGKVSQLKHKQIK